MAKPPGGLLKTALARSEASAVLIACQGLLRGEGSPVLLVPFFKSKWMYVNFWSGASEHKAFGLHFNVM